MLRIRSRLQFHHAVRARGLVVVEVCREHAGRLSDRDRQLARKFPTTTFCRIDRASFVAFDEFAAAADIEHFPTLLVYAAGRPLVKTHVCTPSLVRLLIEHCCEEYGADGGHAVGPTGSAALLILCD